MFNSISSSSHIEQFLKAGIIVNLLYSLFGHWM